MGLFAEESASVVAEFLFGGTDAFEALEEEAAEFAPGPGEIVGDLGFGDRVSAGEGGVGGPVAGGEIVGLEDGELNVLVLRGAQGAEIGDGEREHLALPFAMKEILDGLRGGGEGGEFAFGSGEVEREEMMSAAAFQTVGGFVFVAGVSVDAEAEIGVEAGLGGIEAVEEAALEEGGEEALGEVGGLIGITAPFEADVLVDRLPVDGDEFVEGSPLPLAGFLPRQFENRDPGGGEGQSRLRCIRRIA